MAALGSAMDLDTLPLALPFPAMPEDRRRDAAHRARRLQGLGPLRPDLCRTGRGHRRRRRVHAATSAARPRSSWGASRCKARHARGRWWSMPATPTPSPATAGARRSRQIMAQVARAPRLRAERGVRLLDRGDRRAAAQGQGASRGRGGARSSGRARGKTRPRPSARPTLSPRARSPPRWSAARR